jgi:hypothetical protein
VTPSVAAGPATPALSNVAIPSRIAMAVVDQRHRQRSAGPLPEPQVQLEEWPQAEAFEDDGVPRSTLRCPAMHRSATAGTSPAASNAAAPVMNHRG